MDITYKTDDKKFNYRVCAIIINNGNILAMTDERSPYYYLPGGRVKFGETAEDAVIREIKEELGITSNIERPLLVNQSFFKEDVDNLKYHEICIYFLMDINDSNLLSFGNKFVMNENNHTHLFEWLSFKRLKDEYFYPLFIKEEIYNLPKSLLLRTEIEDSFKTN